MGGATRFFMLLTSPFPMIYHRYPSLLRLSRRHHRRLPLPLSSLSPHFNLTPLSHSHPQNFHIQSSQKFDSQTSTVSDDYTGGVSHMRHPWPEWLEIVHNLSAGGYFNQQGFVEDELYAVGDLSDEFVRNAIACLNFARDRPNLLRMLQMRDVAVVVENGTPFLFKNADDSVRRMRSFLGIGPGNALDTDKADTADLMKFVLSYVSHPSVYSEKRNCYNIEQVESSVRNILCELARLMRSSEQESKFSQAIQSEFRNENVQTPRPFGRNIEMKRGDWICPRCSFMNFARNVKCLECEELRPQRQLTGGEWECPQCDFFNYGRNIVCLRCDCKRSIEVSSGSINSGSGLNFGEENNTSKVDIDSRLAANEEKAQRWFSKISQLDGTSDMNSAIADEDFPEIMPLRKGVNRFVVSTRKTPLERRLANSQSRENLGTDNNPYNGNDFQAGGANKTLNTKIGRSLDEILGRTSATSEFINSGVTVETDDAPSSLSSASPRYGQPTGRNANSFPFAPLPADMFSKKQDNSKMGENEKTMSEIYKPVISKDVSLNIDPGESGINLQLSQRLDGQSESLDKEKEQAEKSERWFNKVAELHDVTDLASAISDDDFPEIMPMRKGENRFVVSKKKDRSLTSPMHKRRMAMDQTSNTNFVPFVPFPPDYFAKKDENQSGGADLINKDPPESSSTLSSTTGFQGNSADATDGVLDTGMCNSAISGENLHKNKSGTTYGVQASENQTPKYFNPPSNNKDSTSSGNVVENRDSKINVRGSSPQLSERSSIGGGWSGKSLEGSAVREPDPLDMSEEAKAERWFRRVAQIKDISELSQIPDEDFPSIMPMRKGVNRFVVSKRKTPLERRLTSTQYRKNLPIVSSDPVKKENDDS